MDGSEITIANKNLVAVAIPNSPSNLVAGGALGAEGLLWVVSVAFEDLAKDAATAKRLGQPVTALGLHDAEAVHDIQHALLQLRHWDVAGLVVGGGRGGDLDHDQ